MKSEILKINHLSVSYGEEDVITDINLSMAQGEVLCIVGESGSGKSTLIKAIHGLACANITSGEIWYDNELLHGGCGCRNHMGCDIGLIPQNPGGSFNPLRPFEKQFREAFVGNGKSYDRDMMVSILESIGLQNPKEILDSRPYEMSGGMNQRIAIALAFALKPRLLLCDEPTSALDVTTAHMVVEQLLDLRQKKQTAICMVTHHLGIAQMMADHIAIMHQGRLIEYGSRDEFFSNPKEAYTKQLMEDVPRLNR